MSAPLSTKALSLLAHIKEGKIETASAKVMQTLMYGHRTRREVEAKTGLTSGSVTARINELVKGGLVQVYTQVKDEATGKRVNSYSRTPEVVGWQHA